MVQSASQTPTFDSGHAYTPKFELWMNGIIWQAIYNIINSYNTVEMDSQNVPQAGIMRTATHAPVDIFIGRVRVLEDVLVAIEKKDTLYENEVGLLGERRDEDYYHRFFTVMLRLLHRNGHVRFKPPRDIADD